MCVWRVYNKLAAGAASDLSLLPLRRDCSSQRRATKGSRRTKPQRFLERSFARARAFPLPRAFNFPRRCGSPCVQECGCVMERCEWEKGEDGASLMSGGGREAERERVWIGIIWGMWVR